MFNNEVTQRMNSEVYRCILSATLQRNALNFIVRNLLMQQDNEQKHTTKTTKNLIR